MTDGRITRDDLAWWLEFAATRDWTFAKTYAETAPHHYVVENRTHGVTHEDMVRAARVIHTFGQPGKYYSLTKIYLVSPDGRFRWWTEDIHFTDTTLVNRATTELCYGIQNAPSTASAIGSPYDAVATFWDAEQPVVADDSDLVRRLLSAVRGKYPPHVLDLGCGTGRVLDLGLASPDRYAGVDSSQAMLNLLIRKHPKVAAIYPLDVRDALAAGTFTAGQFDWVFVDSTVDLTLEQIRCVDLIARLAVISVGGSAGGRGWTVRDVSKLSAERILAQSDKMKAATRPR